MQAFAFYGAKKVLLLETQQSERISQADKLSGFAYESSRIS